MSEVVIKFPSLIPLLLCMIIGLVALAYIEWTERDLTKKIRNWWCAFTGHRMLQAHRIFWGGHDLEVYVECTHCKQVVKTCPSCRDYIYHLNVSSQIVTLCDKCDL